MLVTRRVMPTSSFHLCMIRYEDGASVARGEEKQLDMVLDMKSFHGRVREEREACAKEEDFTGTAAGSTPALPLGAPRHCHQGHPGTAARDTRHCRPRHPGTAGLARIRPSFGRTYFRSVCIELFRPLVVLDVYISPRDPPN